MINFQDYISHVTGASSQPKPAPLAQTTKQPGLVQQGMNAVGSVANNIGKGLSGLASNIGNTVKQLPQQAETTYKKNILPSVKAVGNSPLFQLPGIGLTPKIPSPTVKQGVNAVLPGFNNSIAGTALKGNFTKIPQAIQKTNKNLAEAARMETPEARKNFMMGMVGGMEAPVFKKAQIDLAKNFSPEVRNIVGKFARQVEENPGVNRANLGDAGEYVQSLAHTVFGKDAATMTNKQLKNAFDVLMEQASKTKGNPKLSVGLATNDVRQTEPSIFNFGGEAKPVAAEAQNLSQNLPETPVAPVAAGGTGNPVDDFLNVLKNAKVTRAAQDLGYSAERGQRFNQFATTLKGGGGEAGARAALSRLGGELPKIAFEPLQVTQEVKDQLFNSIGQATHLGEGGQANAIGGLDSLLKGVTPGATQIKALEGVFGKGITEAIAQKQSLGQKIGSTIADVGNIPRAIQSSLDFSAPLRQGIFPASAHPKDFLRSFKNMFGYAFSQNKFDNFYQELKQRPTYPKMRDSGLALTDMGAQLNSREEAFQSNLAEKIPVIGRFIKGSDRAYTGFLNNFRADLFDTLYKQGEKLGKGEDQTYLKSLASFINTATGRGDLKNIPVIGQQLSEAAPLLNATFFSPRLIASRVNLLNPIYYSRLEPTVRKESMKQLVAFVGTGLSILGLAKLAGAEVGTDPTSADFGKIKTGNTRNDLWGGFQPYATFIARMILNKKTSTTTGQVTEFGKGYKPETKMSTALRFGQGKLGPNASFIADYMIGKDFEGNKFDLTSTDPFTNPITKRFIPLIAGDLKNTIQEYGTFGPVVSIPGLFGSQESTYVKKQPSVQSGLGTRIAP